jgi:hypothetical protein
MYAMIKGDTNPSGAVYLTDMLHKIHMRDPQQVQDFQNALRGTPGAVLHNNLNVVVWGQEDVDVIPLASGEVNATWTWWDAVNAGPAHNVVAEATKALADKLDHIIEMLHAETPEPPPLGG